MSENVATPKKDKATKAVSATISTANFEAIENYRWDPKVRKNLSQVIDQAVDEFVKNHKLAVPEAK